MQHIYNVLFNPYAGNGRGEKEAHKLDAVYGNNSGYSLKYHDITKIGSYQSFLMSVPENESIVIAGGDGTMNRFINDTDGIRLNHKVLYFPTGSGNDFSRDLDKKRDELSAAIPMNKYISDLPFVTINGITRRFLNGIGYGLDGYCCEEGDKKRNNSGKPINYTPIAIKGLLFGYKPANAKVTVDGVKHTFTNVLIAPAMNGRFYGGGAMAAPNQDRLNKDGTLTVVIAHDLGKLNALRVFPTIYKGEHIKYTDYVTLMTGREITVSFDRPTPLQIDGETIKNVTSYTVKSGKTAKV